ncbi:GumC family protein [Endothiovibrio diazotrophicus]
MSDSLPTTSPSPATAPAAGRLSRFIAQTSDVRETLEILWRRRALILSLVIIAMTVATIMVNRMTPLYTATVKVMLDTRSQRVVNIQDVMGGLRMNRSTFLGEVEVIRSRKLAQRVIDKLELSKSDQFNPELVVAFSLNPVHWVRQAYRALFPPEVAPASDEEKAQRLRNRIVNRFLGSLSVRPVSLSPVIQISYTSTNPALSASIANALAEAYVESQLEAKFDATRRATMWLNQRLEGLRQKVHDSENAAEQYRSQHGLATGKGSTLTDEKLSDLNARYIIAQSERAEAQARYLQVKRLLDKHGTLETTSDVLQSPVIQRLVEQEALLNRKIAELSSRYGERHPTMIDARSELHDLQGKIRTEISKVASALKSELEVAQSRANALRQALDKTEVQSASEGSATVILRELEREAEANRLIYETFLSRFKETSQQQDIQQADARIISEAVPPGGPSAPRKGLILTVVLVSAIALAIATALFLEVMDVGLKSAEQVETLTGLPVLTMVPKIPGKHSIEQMGRYVLDQPLSTASEAVRNLYTSLRLANPDAPIRRISFTSAVASEGKSTLCLWLAYTAAAQGRKVILIDCDLRRPKLHRMLGVDNRLGIADVIAGSCTLDECIQVDEESGIHAITGKEIHGNALEVLGSDAYRKLIGELERRYDMVLLDAPPILAVSDARVLARLVDTTIYLVRWNSTDKMAVATALKQFEVTGGEMLGVVISQVDTRKHSRYGYGDYGHYYGHYSGYYHQN